MDKRRDFQKYLNLPHNPALKQKAKKLRKAGNILEALMWRRLKNKQFKGLDFDRQKVIGNYIVDFFCVSCGVVIEIDGNSHGFKLNYDKDRDEFLRSLGLVIIRIHYMDVWRRLDEVMDGLFRNPVFGGDV